MIGDAARAEDLVQDTFVSALKCSGRLRQGESVAPWLRTVARRRSIDELRGRDRVALMPSPPDVAAIGSEDPADFVVNQELVEQLRQAIADLSPRERQLLLRQASYGMSLAELAAEEHTSIASVRSVLARARQKLRGSLERGGVFGGVVPVPRFLTGLRERLARWGLQLEPTLPAITGAGARVGEVMAAVVTALALLLTGGGETPSHPDTLLVAAGFAGHERGAGGSGGAGLVPENGTANVDAGSTTPPTTVPQRRPLETLPPEVRDQQLPRDNAVHPDVTDVDWFASSQDSQTILISATGASMPVLFRSTDGGATWQRVGNNTVGQADRRSFPGGKLLVSDDFPEDPRVFAVTTQGVFLSRDGGETFDLLTPALGNSVPSPDFAAGDERLFFAGPPPSVYDAQHDDRPRPLTFASQLSHDGDIVIGPDFHTTGEVLVSGRAVTSTGTKMAIFSCTAQGCTPRATVDSNTPHLYASPSLPNTIFAWRSGYFGRSTDAGRTFTKYTFESGFLISGVYEADGIVYRYGNNKVNQAAPLYRSFDGGATWQPLAVNSPLNKGIRTLAKLPDGRLIAAHAYTGLYCSSDGGVTWTAGCAPA